MDRRRDELLEELGGVPVGPVQVLQQQDDRASASGQHGCAAECHERWSRALVERSEWIVGSGRCWVEQLPGDAQVLAERLQRVSQRQVRDSQVLGAPPDEDDCASATCLRQQLAHEAALPDASRTFDEHSARTAGQRLVQGTIESPE